MAGSIRSRVASLGVVSFLFLTTACSGGGPKGPTPTVNGVVSFDVNQVRGHDFPPPKADPATVCGSDTAQYALELLSTPPQDAKVNNEWAPIIPAPLPGGTSRQGFGGASMPAQGVVGPPKVNTSSFFAGDLPFTHPFESDYTTNIQLDPPFKGLAQTQVATDIPKGSIHSELPRGLFPNDPDGNLSGFLPQQGDRIATTGQWILDCGHADYHSELHNMEFLAFGHAEGSETVAHAFAEPYDVTNLFVMDPSLVTDFSDDSRFTESVSQPFGPYLYNELVGIATAAIQTEHPFAHNLIMPTPTQWPPWYVCAPPGSSGSLDYSSHFTTRPGVSVAATPYPDVGCVRFQATADSSFGPYEPQLNSCPISWTDLLQAASTAGLGGLDFVKAIRDRTPPAFRSTLIPVVKRGPSFDCFEPFKVPPAGGSSGEQTFTDGSQPFPFYGDITVTQK
jgi:hypothetical protein